MRLQHWNYSWAGVYFITICTKGRRKILGQIRDTICYPSTYGNVAYQAWFDLKNHYECYLDEFIIMPDHIHGIIFVKQLDKMSVRDIGTVGNVGAIHELPLRSDGKQNVAYQKIRRNMIIPKMIGRFKMQSGKMINEIRDTPGQMVWQRDYYESVIRSQRELHHVRQYIINNPQNWQRN